MHDSQAPQGLHMVGSTTFSSRHEHFVTIGGQLGRYLNSLPDGEIDPPSRGDWVSCQMLAFKPFPHFLQERHQAALGLDPGAEPRSIKENEDVSSILKALDVKYDTWAIDSYRHFRKLKDEGTLPAHLKFQVNLPTPLSACSWVIDCKYRAAVDTPYEAALIRAVRNIQDKIPHNELVIQFDTCAEMFFLENGWLREERRWDLLGGSSVPWFRDGDNPEAVRASVLERFRRWLDGGHVDRDVDVGVHLCYGDAMHMHFLEPRDAVHLAEMVEQVLSVTTRRIQFVHLPVPKERYDDSYLTPLQAIWPRIQERDLYLYLGLVHAEDKEGTLTRTATARRVLGDQGWGAASECGLGRTPNVESVLEIYSDICKPWK